MRNYKIGLTRRNNGVFLNEERDVVSFQLTGNDYNIPLTCFKDYANDIKREDILFSSLDNYVGYIPDVLIMLKDNKIMYLNFNDSDKTSISVSIGNTNERTFKFNINLK